MAEETSPVKEPRNESDDDLSTDDRIKDDIRKGFATQNYTTGSPKNKKYKGDYWKHGILQIFVGQTDEVVKNCYYCKQCNDIIITNAQCGTATLNRHVFKHRRASFRISRIKVAEMLVFAMRIGVLYGQELSTEYFLENLPNIKEKEW